MSPALPLIFRIGAGLSGRKKPSAASSWLEILGFPADSLVISCNHSMPNSRKNRLVCVLLLADFLLLSSCWPLNPSASVRLMIVNPVNGSSISGSSTRLLLRCVGACDDRAVNVTFSNGENLQVCALHTCIILNSTSFGCLVNKYAYQVHTFGSEASIDIEDLPFGFNTVAVELLPVDAGPLVPPGSAGFSDQVVFFAHPRDDAIGQSTHDVNLLRLLPPSSPVIVGR